MAQSRITDHALLRWLDRAEVIDIGQVRALLSAALARALAAGDALGVPNYLIVSGGMVYVVRDGRVVTVLIDDGRHGDMLAERAVQAD